MSEVPVPLSASKQNLLNAAEQLFADRGFDIVAVRDVAASVKMNIAAVNYHFGTREALISWVVTRCVTPVNDGRLAKLDQLERSYPGKIVPLEELVDAFVRPLMNATRVSELPDSSYYQLMGRIFAMQGAGFSSATQHQVLVSNDRFKRAMGRALPTLTEEDLAWRVHFMIGGMVQMLMQVGQGISGRPQMEAALLRFVRFATAGLRYGVEECTPAPENGPQAMFDF